MNPIPLHLTTPPDLNRHPRNNVATLSKIFLTGQVAASPIFTSAGAAPARCRLKIRATRIISTDPRAEAFEGLFTVEAWGQRAKLARQAVQGSEVLVEGWLELVTWGHMPTGPAFVACDYISVADPATGRVAVTLAA